MKRRRGQLSEEEEEELWEEGVRLAETEEFGEEEPREKEEEVEEFDEEEFERELEEALREEEEEEEMYFIFFQELPPELQQYIIQKLSVEDILNFCLTSKINLYSICRNPYFWLERARQENLSPTLTLEQFTSKDTTPLLVYLSLYIEKYDKLPVSSNKLIRFLLSSPIDLVEHIEWLFKYGLMSPESLVDFALKHDNVTILSAFIASPSYRHHYRYNSSLSLKNIYKRAIKDNRTKIAEAIKGSLNIRFYRHLF